MAQSQQGFHYILDIYVTQDHYSRPTHATSGSGNPTASFWVPHGLDRDPFQVHACPSPRPPHRPTTTIGRRHRAARVTPTCSCKRVPEHHRLSTHRTRKGLGGIRAMTRAQAAAREIWSLDNGARQHQHAHCAQQARPPLLSRTASRACTLTAPGLSVRTVLRVVAVDLLRPRRLAADRAADGLHERCDIRATVDLQHDEQCVTASLPDAPGTAPQPSARRPRQHGDLVASFKPPSPREGAQGASLRFCPGLFYKVRV